MITQLFSLLGPRAPCARLTIPHLPPTPQIILLQTLKPTRTPLYPTARHLPHTPLLLIPTPVRNKDGGLTFPRHCAKRHKARPLAASDLPLILHNPRRSPRTLPTRLRVPSLMASQSHSPPGRSPSTRRKHLDGRRPGRLTPLLRIAAVLGRTETGADMPLRGIGEEMGRSSIRVGKN